MVADKVTVISKAYGSDEAWQWESSVWTGYEMTPAEKDAPAPRSSCTSSPTPRPTTTTTSWMNTASWPIVKKYSDYVRYPIQMEREKSRQKPEPDPKPEDYKPEWEDPTPSWRP